jgi:hypothetical protein
MNKQNQPCGRGRETANEAKQTEVKAHSLSFPYPHTHWVFHFVIVISSFTEIYNFFSLVVHRAE